MMDTCIPTHGDHVDLIHRPAMYNIDGLRICAPSGVYHPHAESSTRMVLAALPDVSGLDVLEIGAGTGAVAMTARERGAARVVATDISERACAAMECNALINGLDIDVRHGDLFAPCEGERFDLVIFNLPLMDKPVENDAELALCDPQGELLERFLLQLPSVVRDGGLALFTHSDMSAPLPLLPVGAEVQPRIQLVRRRADGNLVRVLWWRP